MAAQQGKYSPPDMKKKPTLSKQKTLEIFKVSQEFASSMMKIMKEIEQSPGDQQTKMMQFMVAQVQN